MPAPPKSANKVIPMPTMEETNRQTAPSSERQPPIPLAGHIQALPPYTPIEPFEVLSERLGRAPEDIIKLDANENPYGPCPRARQALAELRFPHIYPDPESRALRAALSAFYGVPETCLLAGAGVDELLDLVVRVFITPGQAVISCPPTFGMYPFDTHLNAGHLVEVPRRADFSLDLPAIHQAVRTYHPKMIFLASPNNPDGSLAPPEVIEELLALPLLVVLDEAYIEFSGLGRLGEGGSRIRQVPERDNLVVLRTFSKWAGLAGLRVGFGAFPRWLMPTLWKAKQPYNVSVAASAAAIASLQEADYLTAQVDRLAAERQRMGTAFETISYLRPYPSRANFILCQVLGDDQRDIPSGAALKAALSQQGILVRYFDTPRLRSHIRISAGRPAEVDRLLEVLQSPSMAGR